MVKPGNSPRGDWHRCSRQERPTYDLSSSTQPCIFDFGRYSRKFTNASIIDTLEPEILKARKHFAESNLSTLLLSEVEEESGVYTMLAAFLNDGVTSCKVGMGEKAGGRSL